MRKRILTMFALILTAVSGAWAQSEWTNIVVNGDMEGTDVSCFYVKESAKSSNMYLAPITDGIGKDNSRAIKLQSSDKDVESWDTQFFIRLPYVLPTGTQYRFSFDYKTDKDEEEDVKFDFQVANEPSQYVWWTLDGWPAPGGTFNTGWQHYEAEFTVSDFEGKAGQKSEQGDWLMLFRTINFNLSANHTATEFIFDNVKVEILTSLIPTLTPEPVTDPKLMMLNVTNTAKNEWQFTQLAGNVEVNVTYYPQATADGAVTATDAQATTDAPLVTIDETKLTGASGLMYFVSETETAPDYDAQGWTDQVPNAKDYTEEKTLYVWYYPIGADGATDADIYSDGDMNARALPVNVLPEPTYNVEFAEGTDPNEWTASPNTDVKKGQTVTVTYSGTRKVIGVKAEKKAAPKLLEFEPLGVKFYYYEGETWGEAINNHPENKTNGWSIDEFDSNVKNNGRVLHENDHDDEIKPDTPVNPNIGYLWGPES